MAVASGTPSGARPRQRIVASGHSSSGTSTMSTGSAHGQALGPPVGARAAAPPARPASTLKRGDTPRGSIIGA